MVFWRSRVPTKYVVAIVNFQTISTRTMFIDYELLKYYDLQQEFDRKSTLFPGFLGFLNNFKSQETMWTKFIVNSY